MASIKFGAKISADIYPQDRFSPATLAKNPYQEGIWYGNDRITLRDENTRAVLVKSTSFILPANIDTAKP